MFLIHGKPLPLDTAFVHDDVQYPANFLRLSTPTERNALGIVEVADPVRGDDRFYFDGDVSRPRDLDALKAQMVGQVKSIAGSLLAPTDWRVVRAAEGVKPLDEETLATRAAIRAASDANEAAIVACATVAELAALSFTWPTTAA